MNHFCHQQDLIFIFIFISDPHVGFSLRDVHTARAAFCHGCLLAAVSLTCHEDEKKMEEHGGGGGGGESDCELD